MSEGRGPESATEPASAGVLQSPFFWLSLIALGLGCFVYYPLFFPETVQQIAIQSEEFFFEANEAAGAPVLLLSCWLLYRRSHYRDLLFGDGSPGIGGAMLVLAAAMYGWGVYTQAPDIQLASVLALLFGGAFSLGGVAAVRAFWVPILFLGFALPLPPVLLSSAMFPIQLVTADYAGTILNGIGVASYVQGDQILRPENTFIVIETCSGVRTIVTLTMLTVLLIDLFERDGWHAAILFVAAPIVAFITNGFRVVTLVLNPHSSIHSIHNLQGIAMLLVGLTAMYLLDLALERLLGSGAPGSGSDALAPEQIVAAPEASRVKRILGIALALVAMIALAQTIEPWARQGGLSETPDAVLAKAFGETRLRKIEPDYQFRGSVRFLAHANYRLRMAGEPMEIFLGVGNEQLRKHTILTPRIAWPESGYAPVEESVVQLEEGGPEVRRMILRQGARSILSYSWYERNKSLPVEWFRQAAALDRSRFVREEHILALRISTPLGSLGTGEASADARIRAAWKKLEPSLGNYAPSQPDLVKNSRSIAE